MARGFTFLVLHLLVLLGKLFAALRTRSTRLLYSVMAIVVTHVYYIDRYNCTLDFSINYVWHDNCELRTSSLRASGSRSARGPSSTVDPNKVHLQ